jgi:hypothetical protein
MDSDTVPNKTKGHPVGCPEKPFKQAQALSSRLPAEFAPDYAGHRQNARTH